MYVNMDRRRGENGFETESGKRKPETESGDKTETRAQPVSGHRVGDISFRRPSWWRGVCIPYKQSSRLPVRSAQAFCCENRSTTYSQVESLRETDRKSV